MAERWAEEFNGDDDEDEALRLAIAMSLGKDSEKKFTPKKQPVLVDLTQDDIEAASEASSPGLQVVGEVKPAVPKMEPIVQNLTNDDKKNDPRDDQKLPSAEPASALAPGSNGLSLLGLDRAKMERERLARIQKRMSAEEGLSGRGDSKRMRMNDENRPPLVTAGKQNVLKGDQAKVAPSSSASSSTQMQASSFAPRNTTEVSEQQRNAGVKREHNSLPFAKGVVKKTWARGQPSLGDDIRLEEVLQKDELEMALISSFQWDQDWMLNKFDLRKTRLILVSTGGDEAEVRVDLIALCLCYSCLCHGTCCWLPIARLHTGVFPFPCRFLHD